MPSFLYEAGPNGHWVFLLLTVVLGGGAAFISGRAIAQTWRPLWQIPVYMILLTSTVRFLHFALFEEPMLSARNFVVDFVVLLVLGFLGYRAMRAEQMAAQYDWLYDRAGKLGWRRRT
jgi:hypothetical protein